MANKQDFSLLYVLSRLFACMLQLFSSSFIFHVFLCCFVVRYSASCFFCVIICFYVVFFVLFLYAAAGNWCFFISEFENCFYLLFWLASELRLHDRSLFMSGLVFWVEVFGFAANQGSACFEFVLFKCIFYIHKCFRQLYNNLCEL